MVVSFSKTLDSSQLAVQFLIKCIMLQLYKKGEMSLTYSYISHLYCPKCRSTFNHADVQNVCNCGSPLLVSYDLESIKNEVDRRSEERRVGKEWRGRWREKDEKERKKESGDR